MEDQGKVSMTLAQLQASFVTFIEHVEKCYGKAAGNLKKFNKFWGYVVFCILATHIQRLPIVECNIDH